jgi:hypothetical protein
MIKIRPSTEASAKKVSTGSISPHSPPRKKMNAIT